MSKEKEPKPKIGPMTTTIGAAGTEFVARKAVLTVNSVIIGAAKNFIFEWGNPSAREAVEGSDIQRVLAGAFEGDWECDSIYVSDDTLMALAATPDTIYTVSGTDTDTASSPASKTITVTIKIDKVKRIGPPDGNGVVKCSAKGKMLTRPTLS